MTHFVVECEALEERRNYDLLDRRIRDPEQRLIHFLYELKDHQGAGAMIKGLWYRRKKMLENMKSMEERRILNSPNLDRVNRSDPGPVGNRQTPMRRRTRGHSAPRG